MSRRFYMMVLVLLPHFVPAFSYANDCPELVEWTKNLPKDDRPAGECAARVRCAGRERLSAVPEEVKKMTERQDSCSHFSGEFGGDRSERDQQVFQMMKQLRCNSVDIDTAALIKKYSADSNIVSILQSFVKDSRKADYDCYNKK